jgi:hypothetical protein
MDILTDLIRNPRQVCRGRVPLGLFDHRPGPRARFSSLPRVGDGTSGSSTVLVSIPPLPRIQVTDPTVTHGAASLWMNDASYCIDSDFPVLGLGESYDLSVGLGERCNVRE